MNARTWSSNRCTISHCWSGSHGRWTRRRRWRGGSCRSVFPVCGGCWKHGCTRAASASIYKCCVYWRRSPLPEVEMAIVDALHLGTIGFDAVKHLLLCRIDQRPPRLDLENYPHLPLADVQTTQAADYMALLSTQALAPAETSAPEVTR